MTAPAMTSTTAIATPNAGRYLQQLCRHFGHKIEARFDAHRGTCLFPASRVEMVAHEDRLEIAVTAANDEGLAHGRRVVWSHLERFAFREGLATPQWTPATA